MLMDTPRRCCCDGRSAWSFDQSGTNAEAERLYRRAILIDEDEKALGPDHLHIMVLKNRLAMLLQAKGDYVAAEPLCRRAIAIQEKAWDQTIHMKHLYSPVWHPRSGAYY